MKLFEPGKIGKLSIKNRIVMAAMGIHGLGESDGRLSQRAIDYYVARAKGGIGLIITGAARTGQIEQLPYTPLTGDMIIDGKFSIGRLSELADSVHDYGAKVATQLGPGQGRNVGIEIRRRSQPVAPSNVPCFFDPKVMARELTVEEIERLIWSFQFASEAVRIAGIDAIEINCHSGYLIDEFLTALWNKRTDQYGGDLDGRLRILLEIIDKIKKGAGDDFPIIVKYGLEHHLEGGRDIEEGLGIARRLEAAGVCALDIDAGCYETWYWSKPTTYSPPGALVDMAEMVKKVVSIPVIAVGKLGYPDLAESVLQEGKADFIALGRPLLADPDWPRKVRGGRLEDIRPCIGDHEGCSGRIATGKYLSCVVNPATGMEREFTIRPAEEKKSVLVVGGGPAGMEAARVAALRGHKVTLYEKGDALGGTLIPASVPDFKSDYKSLINYLSTQMRKLGVTIELGKEATPELIREMNPDVVFTATGGRPFIPEIPGVEKENVVTAVDLLLGRKEVGETVVVIGGGSVGCETALYLAQKGRKLTVVARHDAARDMHWLNRSHLLKLLADADVKISTNTGIREITDEGVAVVDEHGEGSTLECDTVVLALGSRPDGGLFQALEGKVPDVYAVGDCVEPRKVMDAIWEGFRIARLL
ncbi:FAD-dependent oxidoreductase [Chloroflexota bacterium]